ncbi:MAG TPA: leucyl aminopeptidase family protein, partial [Micromonosporaceae bacterium]|nr:leucyl aminopeptidase family protein [Micromonosporaceae bacterium]
MTTLGVRLVAKLEPFAMLALPVRPADPDLAGPESGSGAGSAEPDTRPGVLDVDRARLPDPLAEVADTFLSDVEHSGAAGTSHLLPQPGREPARTLFVGIGDGSPAGWRAAGAAVARGAMRQPSVAVLLPAGIAPEAVAGFTEGALLAAYRFSLKSRPDESRKLRTVALVVPDPNRYAEALHSGQAIAEVVCLARDLTNQPSADKSPAQLAGSLVQAAEKHGVETTVWEPEQLAREGFGGILAVGRGSVRGPRLVELRWSPTGADRHVVLVGKGITFDTGGISIKPREAMLLMRKDMGGAATVAAAVIGAARLNLPVRVTALAPLAENMPGGDAYRPGDVIRHYGGITTEVLNTDAEGRMVLADALAYAADRLNPDVLLDFATLTGAARIGLGKRTAALLGDNDRLVSALVTAGEAVGERMWRLPMPDDYQSTLDSDIADLNNAPGMRDGMG